MYIKFQPDWCILRSRSVRREMVGGSKDKSNKKEKLRFWNIVFDFVPIKAGRKRFYPAEVKFWPWSFSSTATVGVSNFLPFPPSVLLLLLPPQDYWKIRYSRSLILEYTRIVHSYTPFSILNVLAPIAVIFSLFKQFSVGAPIVETHKTREEKNFCCVL